MGATVVVSVDVLAEVVVVIGVVVRRVKHTNCLNSVMPSSNGSQHTGKSMVEFSSLQHERGYFSQKEV